MGKAKSAKVTKAVNWKRGLFRLGLIAYVGWLIFIGWQAYTNVIEPNRAAAAASYEEQTRIEGCTEGRKDMVTLDRCGAIKGVTPDPDTDHPDATPTLWPYGGLALAPALLLIALWIGGGWVGRGFNTTTS